MKKMIILYALTLVITTSVFSASTTSPLASSKPAPILLARKPLEIVCYEKTPDCYVTADKKGCLVISNVRPSKTDKNSSICTLKKRPTKTTYDHSGVKTTTTQETP